MKLLPKAKTWAVLAAIAVIDFSLRVCPESWAERWESFICEGYPPTSIEVTPLGRATRENCFIACHEPTGQILTVPAYRPVAWTGWERVMVRRTRWSPDWRPQGLDPAWNPWGDPRVQFLYV
jgi:hypothetical protein